MQSNKKPLKVKRVPERFYQGRVIIASLPPLILILGGLFLLVYAQDVDEHWTRPIPLQGEPPSNLTPLEVSLNPIACGSCHPDQYSQWKTALHSRSMGPGVLGQLVDMKGNVDRVVSCMNCHAPLDEQIDELLDGKVPEHLVFPEKEGLFKTGVSCGVCHVRGFVHYGPTPKTKREGSINEGTERLPHDGFVVSSIFSDSKFCASCHQFPENGYRLNGKLLENTYNEWLLSPYSKNGTTCQSCHMSDRRHLWRGIHTPEFVREGISVEASAVVRDDMVAAKVTLENKGAGHYFPTYAVPLVVIKVYQVDKDGRLIEETHGEGKVGRYLPLDLSNEVFDTRIPPEGRYTLKYERKLKGDAEGLKFEVVVYPDEFYSRFYSNLLSGGFVQEGKKLIEEALNNSLASSYILFEKVIPLPH